MTLKEMKTLVNEVKGLVYDLARDLQEGYIADARDCIEDIQGISCQIQEALDQRLNK